MKISIFFLFMIAYAFNPAFAANSNPGEECRENGYFSAKNPSNCGEYISCTDGKSTRLQCQAGLAFNDKISSCDWPDEVEYCNSENYLKFNCPLPAQTGDINKTVDVSPEGVLQYFPHPSIPEHYFVCVNGHPRLQQCGNNLIFNAELKQCVSKVPEE